MNRPGKLMLCVFVAAAAANAALVFSRNIPDRSSVVAGETKILDEWRSRIAALVGERRYSEAVPPIRNYLRHAPHDAEMRRMLGRALFEAGRYAEAKDVFYVALLNDPEDFVSRNNLGVVMFKLGSGAAARRELGEALESSEREAFVAVNLAVLCERSGARGEAAALWNAVFDKLREEGGVMIPEDALMLADAETLREALRPVAERRAAAAD